MCLRAKCLYRRKCCILSPLSDKRKHALMNGYLLYYHAALGMEIMLMVKQNMTHWLQAELSSTHASLI